jgi:hypothetical protein
MTAGATLRVVCGAFTSSTASTTRRSPSRCAIAHVVESERPSEKSDHETYLPSSLRSYGRCVTPRSIAASPLAQIIGLRGFRIIKQSLRDLLRR